MSAAQLLTLLGRKHQDGMRMISGYQEDIRMISGRYQDDIGMISG
jgi:hypothetical protein